MTRTMVAIALLAVLGACGTSSTSTSAASTEPPGEPTGLQLIVIPGNDGNLPNDVTIGCPNGPTFPASAIDSIVALDESGRSEIADAMQPFLQSEEGPSWPQEGWHILHEEEKTVIVVAREPTGVSFMTLERRGGTWEWAGASGAQACPLRLDPGKFNTVEWVLDGPPPQPDDTSFAVLATERECVSGQPMGDRLLGPEIVITETEVLLAFAATPPPGRDQNCQGNPTDRVEVELPEPIGDRDIRNGLEVLGNLEDFLP